MLVKFMSWGHTVSDFVRQPPNPEKYHPAVWAELDESIVDVLIDDDIRWFSMMCGWGLIRELPMRIAEVRAWCRNANVRKRLAFTPIRESVH